MATMKRPAVSIERKDVYRVLSEAYENYKDVYDSLVKYLPTDVLMCFLAHIESPATFADTPNILRRCVERRFIELRQQLMDNIIGDDSRFSVRTSSLLYRYRLSEIEFQTYEYQDLFTAHYPGMSRIYVPSNNDDLEDPRLRVRPKGEDRRQSMDSALRVLSFARDCYGLERLCVAAFAFMTLRVREFDSYKKQICARGKAWAYMPGDRYDVVIPKETDHLRLLETVAVEYHALLQRGVDLFAIMSKVLSGEQEFHRFYRYSEGTLTIHGPFFCDEMWRKIESRIHLGFEYSEQKRNNGRHDWLLDLVRKESKTKITPLPELQRLVNRNIRSGRNTVRLRLGLLLESVISALVSKLHERRSRDGSLVVHDYEDKGLDETKLHVNLERLFKGNKTSSPLTRHEFITYFLKVWRFVKNGSDMHTLCEMLYNAMSFTKDAPLTIKMRDWQTAWIHVKFLDVTKKYRCYLQMAADVVRAYKRCKRSGVDMTFYFNDEIYNPESHLRYFLYNSTLNTISRNISLVDRPGGFESSHYLLHKSWWLGVVSMLAEEGVCFNHTEDCSFERYRRRK